MRRTQKQFVVLNVIAMKPNNSLNASKRLNIYKNQNKYVVKL